MLILLIQIATTKGTGGDCIILEEAAYCDPGFFYETVAPLMLIGRTSLLAISTLTSEVLYVDFLAFFFASALAALQVLQSYLPFPCTQRFFSGWQTLQYHFLLSCSQ